MAFCVPDSSSSLAHPDRSFCPNDLAHADGCFDQLHTNGHNIKTYFPDNL